MIHSYFQSTRERRRVLIISDFRSDVKMNIREIEKDPLKFCEDFKKFSENNRDSFTAAQMKVEGTSLDIFHTFLIQNN